MSKKSKKTAKKSETVFEVGKRYLVADIRHDEPLEEVTIIEVAGEPQCFGTAPRGFRDILRSALAIFLPRYSEPSVRYWRRSSDFKIIAELPLNEEGAE